MVWAGMTLDGRTPIHVFERGIVATARYKDEVSKTYVCCDFILMNENLRPHTAHLVNEFHQNEDIHKMNWPIKSPDLIPIE
ncbi:DDE_3 domain-containing protein [Trichonephila clavipes]|nr:DDE_3 domain-containing protein [Trichonephila clavipes]